MRKHLLIIAALLLSPMAHADQLKHADKLKVVTSFTILADMAANVAGEHAEVVSLTKPGAEIHNYQPTPGDILRAQGADVVMWNGLGLERWFERFFQHIDKVPNVILSDGVEPIVIASGPYRGKPNPHAWMSPSDAMRYVDNIEQALIKYDPANQTHYQANAKAYKAQIQAVFARAQDALSAVPDAQRWLVSSEGAFSYLARDINLNEAYLWPINAERQGTPQQVRALIDTVREHQVRAVFSESTVSDAPAKQVAAETDAHYGGILYVDSLSTADGPVPDYLSLLTVTTETVLAGLRHDAL
ncbi:metal ABC transporter substrate-binding protein [Salinivibrio proteolyticus]|uniref:Metal ABC transporter substrate-binding protein n=1 Tax=Salinivibrio proteolyticus TaxID=334715 RepID=A0ABY7LLC5_9GAMM|nr:metal ABC transporter substrate-binding protein [Salinivibrio proteolyticus]WBA16720.1 metal ABC transporter substrate-binding protein [Salinivibrio proteolyticus]